MADDFSDILTQYSDVTPLKIGGQKAVYLITHPIYGVSVLKLGTYSTPQTLERIKREVAVLRDIDSCYFPKNYDFELLPNSRFLIVEEYVDCKVLSSCMQEYTNPLKALELLKELVYGLKILWDKQIVHRDLKPDNILIVSNGMPRIIDLGIARLLKEESLTRTLALRGPATPRYAAPEQLLNYKNNIDFRTDQFNLGIITLQLMSGGAHPFDPTLVGIGDTFMDNIINARWDKSLFCDPNYSYVEPLISRLLGKEPYQRFRTYDLLINEIIACMRYSPLSRPLHG